MMDVPPIAGNIILVRDLFLRAKSSALAVKDTSNFFREEKHLVCFCYLHARVNFENHLKGNLLIK